MEQAVYETRKTAFNHGMISLLKKHNIISLHLAKKMGLPFNKVVNTIFGKFEPDEEFFDHLGKTSFVSGMELEALKASTALPYPTDEEARKEAAFTGTPGYRPPSGYRNIDHLTAVIELQLGKVVITDVGRPYRLENSVLLYEEDGEWKLSAFDISYFFRFNKTIFYVWEGEQ